MKPYSTNPKAVKMREYRAKDPAKHNKYLRDYRKANPEKYRLWDGDAKLKKRYGIGLETVKQMWKDQGGKCACCQQEIHRYGQQSNSAVIDHNHATGVVRAILCNGCNVAIAQLREDPEVCELAAAYLRKHRLPVSDCCRAITKVAGETTRYYECLRCGKPCNAA